MHINASLCKFLAWTDLSGVPEDDVDELAATGRDDAIRRSAGQDRGDLRAGQDLGLELLRDPTRSQVVLVTLPETTPVNEVIETAYALEDRVGVRLGPLVVNGVDRPARRVPRSYRVDDPEADVLAEAARFRRARLDLQEAEMARLRSTLPLERWELPLLPVAGMAAGEVAELVATLRYAA